MPGTNRATLLLSNLGVNFTLHTYAYDPSAERIGRQARTRSASSRGAC
jgi:hypothetical protein